MSKAEPFVIEPGDPLEAQVSCRYCGEGICFLGVAPRGVMLPFDVDPDPKGDHSLDPTKRWDMRYVRIPNRGDLAGKLYSQHKCKERDRMSPGQEVAWLRRCVADPTFLDEDVPQAWKNELQSTASTIAAIRDRLSREEASDVRDGG